LSDRKRPYRPKDGALRASGWGATSSPKTCITTKNSPSPLQPCLKNFKLNNVIQDQECVEHRSGRSLPKGLFHIPEEEGQNICLILEKQLRSEPWKNVDKVKIYKLDGGTNSDVSQCQKDNNKCSIMRKCYRPSLEEGKWCPVCKQKSGCSQENTVQVLDVKDLNKYDWGFCQRQCDKAEKPEVTSQDNLREVQLTYVENRKCKQVFEHYKQPYNYKLEGCAIGSFHVIVREYLAYYFNGTNGHPVVKFKEINTTERTSKRGRGYEDTCQGDSGGPLWYEKDGKAFQWAIVSRGGACGQMDRPGIYTMVQPYIEWIKTIIKNDGKC